MNVPEKLWMTKDTHSVWFEKRTSARFVEYTRTDVFIEKAIDWLQKGLDNGLWVDQHLGEREKEAVIEHFKGWMKETPLSPIK